MSDLPPHENRFRPPFGVGSWPVKLAGSLFLAVVLLGAILWTVVRKEVNADEMLVLVNKTGRDLPPELATRLDALLTESGR